MCDEKVKKSNCLTCGCEIDYYSSSINKKNGKRYYAKTIRKKYCSKECCDKHKQKRKTCICKYCANSFIVYSGSNAKYCSQSCHYSNSKNIKRKTHKEHIITKKINCVKCNNLTKNRTYCSNKCRYEDRQPDKIVACKCCNKEFTIRGYQIRKFCSPQCSSKTNLNCKKITIEQRRNPNIIRKKRGPNKVTIRKCKVCNIDTSNKKYCSSCSKKKYLQANKDGYVIIKRAIDKIKSILIHMSGGCCQTCGYKDNNNVLVFHHINPKDKLFGLDQSSIMKKNIELLLKEHEKCILLCHNCHTELHNIERNKVALNKKYQYRRIKYVKIKLEYIEKFGGKCSLCNKVFNVDNMQSASFHHNRDKLFELNCEAFIKRSDDEIKIEAEKCTLLCMNCHMNLHNPKQST